jgi:hypothetical protein
MSIYFNKNIIADINFEVVYYYDTNDATKIDNEHMKKLRNINIRSISDKKTIKIKKTYNYLSFLMSEIY